MDTKPVPVAKTDRVLPASKKITPHQVQQADLLTVAGKMLKMIRDIGIKPPADYFCLYQMYHETDHFTSPLFMLHYNASGIKFANQNGATKQPTGLPYAWFKNWTDYMASYRKEMTKGSNPSGATTIEDFAHRLKLNKYYEDTEANYVTALKRAQKALSGFTGGANQNAPYKKPDSKIAAWWHGLSFMHKLEFGAAGAVVGLVIIKKLV